MKQLLQEIRSEIEKICPKHLKITKKEYATKKEIADFETTHGWKFPEELVEFWLNCDFEITLSTEIYKTLNCDDGPTFFMMDELSILIEYWKENAGHPFDEEFDKGSYFDFPGRGYTEKILTDMVFDYKWFPLSIDSYDGSICIDLNPGANGTYAQIIYMMYIGDSKSGPYYSGYRSLKELLENYLEQLKERNIEIEEDIIYLPHPFK